MAFYLKYRPRKIADLGLVEVKSSLFGFLRSDDLPHALLFTGTRGIGKTSSARIWAQAINCQEKAVNKESKKTIKHSTDRVRDKNKAAQKIENQSSHLREEDLEPCGECDNCREIIRGASVDVIEMDAASNRSIDDIRALREKIKLAPTRLKYKVYIIDEVHMLTKEAFNALLKTLEEPPSHAMFVLCTTDVEKLPETILSRCIQVNFRRARVEEIENVLKRIVDGEQLEVAKDYLNKIAHLANGSFRDGTKILEDLLSGGKVLDEEKFGLKYGLGDDIWQEFGLMVENKDLEGLINWIETRVQQGADVKALATQIVEWLHLQWLNSDGSHKIELQKLLGRLDESWYKYSSSLLPQLSLELAFVDWANEQGLGNIKVSVVSEEVRLPVEKNKVSSSNDSKIHEEKSVITEINDVADGSKIIFVIEIQQKWDKLLAWVKDRNVSVEALLRAAKPIEVRDQEVIMEVAYPFHKEKLSAEPNRKIVEAGLLSVLGVGLHVSFVMGNKNDRPKQKSSSEDLESSARDITTLDSEVKARSVVDSYLPVPAGDDESLVKFAEEIFGK